MSSSSRRVAVIRCRWPTWIGGSPGSVTSTASSPRRVLQLAGPERRGPLRRPAPRAPAAPRCRACPTARPLLGRELRDRAQDRRQLGLAAQVPDAELLELRGGRGLEHGPLGLLGEPLEAARAVVGARGRAVRPWSGDQAWLARYSYRQRVAVIATFSESAPPRATGTWAISSQRGHEGSAAGRRARRRARTARLPSSATSRSGRPAPGTRRDRAAAPPRASSQVGAGDRLRRTPRPCRRAPPWRRTDRPCAGSARRTRPRTRCADAQDRPDVPGIGDVVQVENAVRAPRDRCRRDVGQLATPRSRASRCRAIPRTASASADAVTRSASAGSASSRRIERLARHPASSNTVARRRAVAQRRRRACPRPPP